MSRPDFPHTLAVFQTRFATEDDCRGYLVECRWPDSYRCPHCGHSEASVLTTRGLLQCSSCRHQASVTARTVLHRASVPLHEVLSGRRARPVHRGVGGAGHYAADGRLARKRAAKDSATTNPLPSAIRICFVAVPPRPPDVRQSQDLAERHSLRRQSRPLPHYINEYVFRFDRRGAPMAAFRALQGLQGAAYCDL